MRTKVVRVQMSLFYFSAESVDKVCRKGKRVFSVLLNTKQTLPRLFGSRAFVFAVHLAANAKFALMVSSVLFQAVPPYLCRVCRDCIYAVVCRDRILPGWGKRGVDESFALPSDQCSA